METTKYTLADMTPREVVPGYRARFITTAHTTHAYWEIDPGIPLPEHSHPHEQIVNVLEGTIELVVSAKVALGQSRMRKIVIPAKICVINFATAISQKCRFRVG